MTLDRLRAEMGAAAQLPGVANIWTMPIINRIDMLTTGIRSEVGVKVFGADLTTLEALARQVSDVIRGVPGASNVYPEQVTSGQYLNIVIDRPAAARYGIGVGDIQQVIEHAVGETVLTTTIEGRRRFPVRVLEFSIRRGSGGVGLFSGGNGVIRRIEFLKPLTVSILSQRRGQFLPYGCAGGLPGAAGRNTLQRAGQSPDILPAQTQFSVQPGDVLTIETPGGGGWGEPR